MKKETIVDSAIFMFLGTLINIAISVFTTPLITRIVLPEDYGQWSLFTSYSNVAMAVFMIGLDQALVRFYYREDSFDYKRYLIHIVVRIPVAVCLAIGTAGFFFFGKLNLFSENTTDIYILMLLNVLVLIVNRISFLVLRMEQKGKQYSFLIVTNKIIYLLIFTFLIFCTSIKDFLVLCLSTFLSQLAVTVISIVMERKKWTPLLRKPGNVNLNTRQLLLYGLPFVYSILATDIFNFADKWVIKALKTYSDVGIYSAAANIVAITSIIQSTFSLLWAPMAMKQYEKNSDDKEFYIKANGCITLAMFAVGAGVICFKDIIVLLLGGNYRFAATVVPFLLFNPIMCTISETTVYGINFKNKTWYHMIITTVAATVNVILNFILVPLYSSEGAALATAVSYTVFFIMRTLMANHCYPVNFPLFKFFTVTVLFFGYAFLNSFTEVPFIINLMLAAVFIIILILLYKRYTKILFSVFIREINNRFIRKLKCK